MKVELWEDLVCSWCGIANERVNKAMRRFGHEGEVELVHRSFRLLPDLPEGEPMDFAELSSQRGISPAQMKEMAAKLQRIAAEEGIEPYHVADNAVGNTTLAHEFLAWASAQGKQHEAWDLLFRANFGDKADLWSIEDLVPFADRLGLDAADARRALEARTYRSQVENDHREAIELGSQGVPFLVIDRRYGISGAQSVETIVKTLQQAWDEKEKKGAHA